MRWDEYIIKDALIHNCLAKGKKAYVFAYTMYKMCISYFPSSISQYELLIRGDCCVKDLNLIRRAIIREIKEGTLYRYSVTCTFSQFVSFFVLFSLLFFGLVSFI